MDRNVVQLPKAEASERRETTWPTAVVILGILASIDFIAWLVMR